VTVSESITTSAPLIIFTYDDVSIFRDSVKLTMKKYGYDVPYYKPRGFIHSLKGQGSSSENTPFGIAE